MRVISTLMTLPTLLAMLFPQIALAAETNTNETQTKFKIGDSISIVDGVAYNTSQYASSAPYQYAGYEPVKTKDEIKRDEMLAKYKEKIEKANLPEGQFVINASAYTAAADECGKSDGITASGVKVKENQTIACPPQFPFGTKIKVEGRGTYVCEDRGGAIKGNHFDIYMQTKSEAFAFGRRNLLAEVVK